MHLNSGPVAYKETKAPFLPFVVYLILFFAAWTGWVYWLYPYMVMLGTDTLAYALTNISVRLLFWVVPVFLYLHSVDHVDPPTYLKLKAHWRRGILVGLVISLLNFGGSILRFGFPHLSMDYVTWNSILSTSIMIGFVEEIPFRGFILQKLQEKMPFWPANLLSSLLFLGIHLPGWLLLGQTLNWLTMLTIFIIGVILAAAFYYSKSLWSSIIAHSLNDFLTAVLFHI